MSVVTGVTLHCSICEDSPTDDAPPDCVEAINAWLIHRGFGPLKEVTSHYGGTKHPQTRVFGAGYNYFPEDEFLLEALTQAWEHPENLVLIINPENGPAYAWRWMHESASPESKRYNETLAFCAGYDLNESVTLGDLLDLLKLHHDHQRRAGPVGVQDGKGGWIEIDVAEAYAESSLCDRTTALFSRIRKRQARSI